MKGMKGLLFCAVLLGSLVLLQAQEQEWLWANGTGGPASDIAKCIASDSVGNSYVVGNFRQSVSFGSTTLSTLDLDGAIFLAKMNSYGSWEWAKKIENPTEYMAYALAITVDTFGNVIITGGFSGYLIFGNTTLYANGTDIYISKIDSQGNWIWAMKLSSSYGNEYSYAITTDSLCNIYVTGQYYGTLTIGSTILPNTGWNEIFVAKMTSDGNWLWASHSGGTCDVTGRSISVDQNQNVYLVGDCTATATFGSVVINGYNSFVAQMDVNGNWVWAKGFKGETNSQYKSCALHTDASSMISVFIAGIFSGSSTFGNSTLTSEGGWDVFVAKLDGAGNWQWAIRGGSTGSEYASGIVIDSDANAYINGQFSNTFSIGSNSAVSLGSSDVFVAKIDNAGNCLWVLSGGSASWDGAYGIAIDASGNIYTAGTINSNASFGSHDIDYQGDSDIFVAKVGYPQIEASFVASPLSGIQPLPVQFTDQSQQGSGPVVSWLWDFGDGNTSTLQNPTHIYNDAGVFDVSLTVTNSSDSTSTLVREDYITVIDDEASILLQTSDHMNFGPIFIEEFSAVQTLTFSNNGSQPLTFTSSHLMGSPANFQYQIPGWDYTWDPGETGYIYIRFAPVEIGAIEDTLVIVNNSANHPIFKITLTGTGLHVPLQPPQNVQIAMNGNDAVISWDAVTQNTHNQPITPDYYLVFYNGSSDPENGLYYFHGASNTLSYTHYLVGLHASYMFYRVVAFKYYGRGAFDITSLGLEPGMPEDEVMRRLRE